jgi:hypothetical protein
METSPVPLALDPGVRRRFWSRLCGAGLVRHGELVRVHRVAQARRIAPEEALVTLGLLTRDQVVEFLTRECPFGFLWEGLGVS